ncbi:MAG: hypothetical protein ACN6OP_02660 [Pseudomonadales bacterium]
MSSSLELRVKSGERVFHAAGPVGAPGGSGGYYARTQVARRLGVHPCHFEWTEGGTVELGPWLPPAIENILLD